MGSSHGAQQEITTPIVSLANEWEQIGPAQVCGIFQMSRHSIKKDFFFLPLWHDIQIILIHQFFDITEHGLINLPLEGGAFT